LHRLEPGERGAEVVIVRRIEAGGFGRERWSLAPAPVAS